MKFRIIKIESCKTTDAVLLLIERDEDGIDCVKIIAWHRSDNEDLIQIEEIRDLPSMLMMERYISDFSEVSANEFVNNFEL